MNSEHDGRPSSDRHRDVPGEWPSQELTRSGERDWQNGGRATPDSFHRLRQTSSDPRGQLPPQASWDTESRKSSDRVRTRQRGRNGSGQMRICKKCGEPLTGQFVRALDGTFHLDCFKCRVRSLQPSVVQAVLTTLLTKLTGLRSNSSIQVLPCGG